MLAERRNTMSSIKQQTSCSQADGVAKPPEEFPHGLITPPTAVRERIEQERTKHAPELFAKHEQRLLNDWTIGYTFDSFGVEVVYRPTPRGPEVLAVGMEEVIALRKTIPVAEQMNLETYLS
jgi:hypothetical protein